MNKTIIISILLVISCGLFAQKEAEHLTKSDVKTGRDTIVISNGSKGISYSMNGEMLHSDKYTTLFSKNTGAKREYEIVKDYKLYATVLTIAGTVFLLYGISEYLAYENEPIATKSGSLTASGSYSAPLIIGLSAIAVSFPLVIGSKIHLRKAVILYNQSVNPPTSQNMYLKLGIASNRIGLRLVF